MAGNGGDVIEQLRVNIEATSTGVNSSIDDLKDKLVSLNDIVTTLANNYSYTQNLANMGAQFQSLGAAINSINAGNLNTVAKSIGYLGGKSVTSAVQNIPQLAAALGSLSGIQTNFPDLSGLNTLAQNISGLGKANAQKAAANIASLSTALSSLTTLNGVQFPDLSSLASAASTLSEFGRAKMQKAIANIPQLATALQQLGTAMSGVNISGNTIAYIQALAQLGSTGSSAGAAANSITNSLRNYGNQAKSARVSTLNLVTAVGMMRAAFYAVRRVAGFFKEAVDNASDLVEVQHVVNVTFGEYANMMDQMASSSIQNYGMSELTARQIGSRFQAMGMAMGFARGEMADMSISLTKLAGDMASFYNVDYADAAKSLEAIFTGQTRPMRAFGVDLTQTTLQEYALSQGITTNVAAMSQAEKTALRYQYVLERMAMVEGDFVKTADKLCVA